MHYAKIDTKSPSPRPALHVLRSPTVELTVERAMLTSRCKMHTMSGVECSQSTLKTIPLTRFSLQLFAWQESHITEVRTASVTQVRLDGLWEMVGQGYAHCLPLQARVLKHFNLHASICLLVCLVACLTGYWYNRVNCYRAAG